MGVAKITPIAVFVLPPRAIFLARSAAPYKAAFEALVDALDSPAHPGKREKVDRAMANFPQWIAETSKGSGSTWPFVTGPRRDSLVDVTTANSCPLHSGVAFATGNGGSYRKE